MSARTSLLVDVAIILALIFVGIVGYRLSPLLLPDIDITVTPEPGCDLQKRACSALLPEGGRVHLALTPRPIPVVEPMDVVVELENTMADGVSVDFAGVSMNMGMNRQPLERLKPGRFAGRATLPVCVTGSMAWEATVLVVRGRTHIAVPFRFEVGH